MYGRPVHRPSPLVSRWLTEMDDLEDGRSTVDGDVQHARMIWLILNLTTYCNIQPKVRLKRCGMQHWWPKWQHKYNSQKKRDPWVEKACLRCLSDENLQSNLIASMVWSALWAILVRKPVLSSCASILWRRSHIPGSPKHQVCSNKHWQPWPWQDVGAF